MHSTGCKKGESLHTIAKDLGVGNSTIKDWRKNRKDFQSFSMTVVEA
jgi:transposase